MDVKMPTSVDIAGILTFISRINFIHNKVRYVDGLTSSSLIRSYAEAGQNITEP